MPGGRMPGGRMPGGRGRMPGGEDAGWPRVGRMPGGRNLFQAPAWPVRRERLRAACGMLRPRAAGQNTPTTRVAILVLVTA
jgi:hypothetical protein